MSLMDISDGIKSRLTTIKGLKVFATKELPDSINSFPTALIMPGETAYVTTFSSNDSDYNFRIILVFSRADSPSTISKMVEYIAVSGDKSIVAAIHADRTLEGKAEDCKVTRNMGIGSLNWGGYVYMSTEFLVQVWAE